MLLNCNDCCGSGCSPAQSLTVTVKDCGGTLKSGATVTVTGPGGYNQTCTTNASGVCTVSWSTFGTYTVSVTDGTYSNSTTVTTTLCQTYNTTLCLGANTLKICVTLQGNCKGLTDTTDIGGVTVVLQQGGVTVASGSPTNMRFCVCVPNNGGLTDVGATFTNPRWTANTASINSAASCTTKSVTLSITAASGYTCWPCGTPGPCSNPIANTLHLTDSFLGVSATLTLAAGGGPLDTHWIGSTTYTAPAIPGCSCPGGTTTVTYKLGYYNCLSGTACCLQVTWTTATGAGKCPGNSTGGATAYADSGPTVTVCPESGATQITGGITAATNATNNAYLYFDTSCVAQATTFTVTE